MLVSGDRSAKVRLMFWATVLRDVLRKGLPSAELFFTVPTRWWSSHGVLGFVEGDGTLVCVLMRTLCMDLEGSLCGKHILAERTGPLERI